MMRHLINLSFCFVLGNLLIAQSSVDTQLNSINLEISTLKSEDNPFKQIKLTAHFHASLNEIMAALNDVNSHKDWVYRTPESRLISYPDDSSIIYYVMLDLPFPASDRDIIIDYHWKQDEKTKVVKTFSKAINYSQEIIPEGVIRVSHFESEYILTPINEKEVHLEYSAKLDPGGSLPAWLVNLGVTVGPKKTMKALNRLIKSGHYKTAKIHGIEELNYPKIK